MRILVLLLSFLSLWANGQTYKSISSSVNVYLGVSNMLGDLGGTDFIGNDGIFDVDLRATRPAIGVGYNFNVGSIALGTNLLYTHLYGDDAFTIQEFQRERNLSVRTNLLEWNLMMEWRPFSRSYDLSRFYLTAGVAGIYYNPKAAYNDEWVELRPLGTEGQYFLDGSAPYSEIDWVIPFGAGYKFRLSRSTSLVLELTARKTFTDYLDDVSTVYADPVLLEQNNGELARILADRSANGREIGSERGNPESDDMYVLLGFKLEQILGGGSGDGCYYNKKPRKRRSTRINQRGMFKK
jgi:hypothetical protein